MRITESQLRRLVRVLFENVQDPDDPWHVQPYGHGHETEFSELEDLSEPSYGERDDDDVEAMMQKMQQAADDNAADGVDPRYR